MIRRLLLASSALLASPVAAQEWQIGPQTPSYPGGALAEYPGVIGDGTTDQGGVAPAEAFVPEDIPSSEAGVDVEEWITDTNVSRNASDPEHKLRFVCNASHEASVDPILYPGQIHESHDHTFVGNMHTDQNSTFESLRENPGSTCPGGPVNPSAYWETSVKKQLPSGVVASIKPDLVVLYYVHNATESPTKYPLLNGLGFIFGRNPDDPNDLLRKAEIPSGFAYITDGFGGWACYQSDGVTPVDPDVPGPVYGFQTPEGTDPWGGRCTAGMMLVGTLNAPDCWDGKNLTAVGGRDHLRHRIRHVNSGKAVCPTDWFTIPALEVKPRITHGGWSDYSTWWLSSDRHGLDEEDWRTPGSTFHADYILAWDRPKLDKALQECLGITIGGVAGSGAGCDYSTIGIGERLLSDSASPDPTKSNDPIVNLSLTYWNDPNNVRFFPIPEGTKGPFTIHSHPDH